MGVHLVVITPIQFMLRRVGAPVGLGVNVIDQVVSWSTASVSVGFYFAQGMSKSTVLMLYARYPRVSPLFGFPGAPCYLDDSPIVYKCFRVS
jgi:hypothetical protein